jgi:pyruvate kinase
MRKTGIICTIGPASRKADILKKMIEAGMNMVRLNFSHGKHRDHRKSIRIIKDLNDDHSCDVKILQDLEGFRIRIGEFGDDLKDAIKLYEKQIIVLSNKNISSPYPVIPLDYYGPLTAIKPGNLIYIDDGNISLRAVRVSGKAVKCVVIFPGVLREHKGVNIPDAEFPFAELGGKDRRDLEFGITNGVDFVAQSFVRNKQDMIDIRDILSSRNFECKLIAKIENKEGLRNIDEILDVSDGIMVARGDLGVSLPVYEVPIIQKMIIKKCCERNKIGITATQMLDSMITHYRPTRAEVSDVANAILDGSSFVMLSGETAVGKYPVETVEMMKSIINFTEQSQLYK